MRAKPVRMLRAQRGATSSSEPASAMPAITLANVVDAGAASAAPAPGSGSSGSAAKRLRQLAAGVLGQVAQ